MTRYLLDVNVLIALVDPSHAQHDVAHRWFERKGRAAFATCPITENGLLRIVGNPRYPNSPGPPSQVANLLAAFRAMPGHKFWPDHLSLCGGAGEVDITRLSSHEQLTDTYLLALARANGGRLATLDTRIDGRAVPDGPQWIELL